jgi:hypothetical protein
VNDPAACYKRQGLKVKGPRGENQIVQKLTKVLALDRTTVIDYIDKDFLQSPPQLARAQGLPIVPASQRIEKALGKSVVERHRVEVLEAAKRDPEF